MQQFLLLVGALVLIVMGSTIGSRILDGRIRELAARYVTVYVVGYGYGTVYSTGM